MPTRKSGSLHMGLIVDSAWAPGSNVGRGSLGLNRATAARQVYATPNDAYQSLFPVCLDTLLKIMPIVFINQQVVFITWPGSKRLMIKFRECTGRLCSRRLQVVYRQENQVFSLVWLRPLSSNINEAFGGLEYTTIVIYRCHYEGTPEKASSRNVLELSS